MRKIGFLLIVMCCFILLSACERQVKDKELLIRKNYFWFSKISMGGGLFGNNWQYMYMPELERRKGVKGYILDTILYVHYISKTHNYSSKENSVDTLATHKKVVITKFQADSIFYLTKNVIRSMSLNELDTLPKIIYSETDDFSGFVKFSKNGQSIEVGVGKLHDSQYVKQTMNFNKLYTYFSSLFSKE